MKKLLFTLALIFTLLIGCEKWELVPEKLNGTFTSEIFKLPYFDSVQISLKIDNSIISEMILTPIDFKYKYLFEVDSIRNKVIYFNLQAFLYKSFGALEIEESDLNQYKLIGYLNIYDPYDKWKYTLYFK